MATIPVTVDEAPTGLRPARLEPLLRALIEILQSWRNDEQFGAPCRFEVKVRTYADDVTDLEVVCPATSDCAGVAGYRRLHWQSPDGVLQTRLIELTKQLKEQYYLGRAIESVLRCYGPESWGVGAGVEARVVHEINSIVVKVKDPRTQALAARHTWCCEFGQWAYYAAADAPMLCAGMLPVASSEGELARKLLAQLDSHARVFELESWLC